MPTGKSSVKEFNGAYWQLHSDNRPRKIPERTGMTSAEDAVVCACCLDGESTDDNEIVFCDNCDVAVHQLCYGISSVPETSW